LVLRTACAPQLFDAAADQSVLRLIGEHYGMIEQVLVMHPAGLLELHTQSELALEHGSGARVERDTAVLRDLGAVSIDAGDPGLGDAEDAVRGIVIVDHQGNLFGRAQAREEAELIVVALRLAPVAVNRGDKGFRILDAEGSIFGRSFLLMRALFSALAGLWCSGWS
jgi:hypothetical protein